MAQNWYYQTGGTKYGPVSTKELKNLANTGEIGPTDLVRSENGTWKAASEFKGLLPSKPPEEPAEEKRSRGPFILIIGIGVVACALAAWYLIWINSPPSQSEIDEAEGQINKMITENLGRVPGGLKNARAVISFSDAPSPGGVKIVPFGGMVYDARDSEIGKITGDLDFGSKPKHGNYSITFGGLLRGPSSMTGPIFLE